MAKKILNFTVDTIQSSYSPIGTVKQLDSVFFIIQITESGAVKNITEQTIRLFAKKNDGKIVVQRTDINIINPTEGKVSINLLNAALQCTGLVTFELEISDNTGTISTANFILKVQEKIANDKVIESTNEIGVLKEIEDYVAQAKIEIQEFKALKDDMVETNNNINIQEAARVQAENLRIEAELNREKSLENLEELKTNYFGKEFDTPQERFLNEFEYVHMSGERGSFLPFSASKNHKIQESIEGKTRNMVLEGETLQNLNNFSLSNTTKDENGYYTSTVPTYDYLSKETDKVLFKPSTTYTLIVEVIENTFSSTISFRGNNYWSNSSNMMICGAGQIGVFKLLVTTKPTFEGSQPYAIWIAGNNPATTTGMFKLRFMLLEGDWTNKEIPTYFEGIKSVGQENNKISILSHGKNLFCDNFIKTENNTTVNEYSSKRIDFIRNSGSTQGRIYCFNLKKGEYTFSCNVSKMPEGANLRIDIVDSKTTMIKSWYMPKSVIKHSFSLSHDATFCLSTDFSGGNIILDNIQLEEGTTVTSSEPYKENKKDILIPFADGLKGIGNTKDEINSMTNKVIQRIGKYTFTGDEGFTLWADREESSSMAFKVEFSKMNWDVAKRNSNVISNNFNLVNNNADIYYCRQNGVSIGYPNEGTGDIISFAIPRASINPCDVNGFKKWLKNNPTTIYYELANPIEYDLTNIDLNLNTYKDLTYITTEAISTFSAPVAISNTIARLNRENKRLEEENFQLQKDTKILASVMLNILEPMLLPEGETSFNTELLKKLNNIVQN